MVSQDVTPLSGRPGLNPQSYFDRRASVYWEDLYSGVATNHYQLLLRRRRELVLEMIQNLEGPALELGCGPGVLVDALTGKSRLVLGDISFEMVQQARSRAAANALSAQLSANALPFRAGSLKLVTAVGLLEYVEDEDAALQEIHDVLASDGVALITFPARKPIEHALRRLVGRPAAEGREHGYRAARLMLERDGFHVEEARPFHYFYFPWSRLLFRTSCFFNSRLERLERVFPPVGLVAQSWIFKVSKR